jgi:hypothetical protein
MQHSNIVGGSTAKRVIACPASVKLVQQIPSKDIPNEHADRGTLLHNVIADVLEFNEAPEKYIGTKYNDQVLTEELIHEKLNLALEAFKEVGFDVNADNYMVETRVGFGDFLPGVFGSTDVLGRIGNRAIVLDWKFGDGVLVDAEENYQLLFYAAAAMRTDVAKWVFEGATEIECIIVQPPEIRRWVTTPQRVALFEQELRRAVHASQSEAPMFETGDHCRWCAAKPICPKMTGQVERVLQTKLQALPIDQIALQLEQADTIESYIKDLRALAMQMLENGQTVPGFKLVAKRGTRQWVDEDKVVEWGTEAGLFTIDLWERKLKSPAQLEKVLKTYKLELPSELVVSVSSGSTLAPESDSRPAVLQIGKQLSAALSKI